MMRKAKWKRVVAAGAILMSLGMVFPSADIQAEEVDFGPGIVEIVDDDSISPCADQIVIVYRVYIMEEDRNAVGIRHRANGLIKNGLILDQHKI
ncbi:MAG: hypothetical protein V8Q58_13630 [Anaerobutyricum hallii]|uniref:hypothetical protein n=1 Tax=Anaerobutyricum hallii TaxID=39488 RepID=UPI00300F1C4B